MTSRLITAGVWTWTRLLVLHARLVRGATGTGPR